MNFMTLLLYLSINIINQTGMNTITIYNINPGSQYYSFITKKCMEYKAYQDYACIIVKLFDALLRGIYIK
jgi:hypothetical protein